MALPPEAASISLGHFLELGLGLSGCSVGGRPLHHEFARYFGVGGCLVCFQYERVAPNSVLMPPHQIAYSLPVQQHWLEEEVDELIEVTTISLQTNTETAEDCCSMVYAARGKRKPCMFDVLMVGTGCRSTTPRSTASMRRCRAWTMWMIPRRAAGRASC